MLCSLCVPMYGYANVPLRECIGPMIAQICIPSVVVVIIIIVDGVVASVGVAVCGEGKIKYYVLDNE